MNTMFLLSSDKDEEEKVYYKNEIETNQNLVFSTRSQDRIAIGNTICFNLSLLFDLLTRKNERNAFFFFLHEHAKCVVYFGY